MPQIVAAAVAESALAATAATAASTALPAVTAAALPTIAAPVATTAAANLGTTAALEASKQGIIQAGAQQAGVEAAKQAGVEAAKQTAAQAANPGILNNAGQLTSSYTAPPMGAPSAAAPVAPPPGTPAPYDLMSKGMPDIATKPIDQIASTSLPQSPLPSTNIADGANVAKDVVGNPNLKMPNMPELTTAKAPPSAFDRGVAAAQKFAGDTAKFAKDHPYITTAGIMAAQSMSQPSYNQPAKKKYSGSGGGGGDFKYGEPSTGEYTPIFEPTAYAREGGLMGYAVGGPVEQMSAANAMGANTGYPMANLQTPMYANPMMSRPMPTNVINPSGDAGVNMYSGEARMATGGKVSAFERMMKEEEARKKQADAQAKEDLEEGKSIAGRTRPYSRTQSTNSPYAAAIKEFQALNKKYGIPTAAPAKTNIDLMGDQDQIEYAANGGIMHGLGGYSDGGRLLRGPGDGVSDSIPAVIGKRQPARLADGEFVIPARIVSELGNGSTEAGARKLYAMMERVQKRRGKTVGKGKVAVNSKADKHLPA